MKYNQQIDKFYLTFIIYSMEIAIENGDNECYIGYEEIEGDDSVNELWIEKKEWLKFLDICIDFGIELEEYEICKYLKQLKSEI